MRGVLSGLCSLPLQPATGDEEDGWTTSAGFETDPPHQGGPAVTDPLDQAGSPTPGVRQRLRRAWPLWRRSSRIQICLVVLGMALVGMLGAGAFAYTSQVTRITARVDQSLTNTLGELQVLAEEGIDPLTSEPFTDPERLVAVLLAREVTYDNEGIIGVVAGIPRYFSRTAEVRLQDDAVLLAQLEHLVVDDNPRVLSLETPVAQYRLLVAPIIDLAADDGPSVVLVVGFDMNQELDQVRAAFQAYFIIAGIALAGIAVAAWVIVGRLLKPVRELMNATRQIQQADLSARLPVVGHDDMAAMADAFNDMAASVETLVESQRQLADDVSHELRTPMTVIRGHLELMVPHDVESVVAARDRALGELDRASRLLHDLMTLATSDQPEFVKPRPVGLADLTDEVLDKATVLGPRRWRLDALADAQVELDPGRITQAWLQLAANAVKYSEPETTIGIGSLLSPDGRTVSLWVRDEGQGIDPVEHERIFERFARARSTAGRKEGAGLGLSIVAAISRAHGGVVKVVSEPGRGAIFTMELPVRTPIEAGQKGGEQP